MGNQFHYPLDRYIYSPDSAIHLLNNWEQKVMGSTPIESTRISSEQAWLAGWIVRASKVFSGFSRGVVKPCGELEGDALKSCLLEDYVFFLFLFFCVFVWKMGGIRRLLLAAMTWEGQLRGQSFHTRENISASYADYYGGASVTDWRIETLRFGYRITWKLFFKLIL